MAIYMARASYLVKVFFLLFNGHCKIQEETKKEERKKSELIKRKKKKRRDLRGKKKRIKKKRTKKRCAFKSNSLFIYILINI